MITKHSNEAKVAKVTTNYRMHDLKLPLVTVFTSTYGIK